MATTKNINIAKIVPTLEKNAKRWENGTNEIKVLENKMKRIKLND